MKSEWDSYYEPIERKVTNKGEAYQGAMTELDFFEGWVTTPTQLGREIDGKAAHWLMTVLLKRNIVVSRKSMQEIAHVGYLTYHISRLRKSEIQHEDGRCAQAERLRCHPLGR